MIMYDLKISGLRNSEALTGQSIPGSPTLLIERLIERRREDVFSRQLTPVTGAARGQRPQSSAM